MTPQQFADFASALEGDWRVRVTSWRRLADRDLVRYVVTPTSSLPIQQEIQPAVECYGLRVLSLRAVDHDGDGIHFAAEIGVRLG